MAHQLALFALNYRYLLFATVLLFSAGAARAQTDFRPGYVVLPAGDTLRGEVDYRGDVLNSRRCRFKAAAGVPQVYAPAELRGYGYADARRYAPRVAPQSDSAGQKRPNRLFFLEVLVAGPANLYYRGDSFEGGHYYLSKAGADPTKPVAELVQQYTIVEVEQRRYRQALNRYRDTLWVKFADCPAVQSTITGLRFAQSALVDAVTRYNACREPGTPVSPVKPPTSSQQALELVVGTQTSQINIDGDVSQAGAIQAGLGPTLGVAWHLVNQHISHKVAFRFEALYAQQSYEKESAVPFGYFTSVRTYDMRLKLGHLRLPLVVRYTFPRGAVRPFVEAGLSVSYLLRYNGEVRYQFGPSNSYGPWQPVFAGNLRRFETGYLAGVGLQLPGPAQRPLSVMARVERSNGFLEAVGFGSTVWRYHFLLGYRLGKRP